MSRARIIVAQIGDKHRVDAMIGGNHAQAEYRTPASARQAAIAVINAYDEGLQDPAVVLANQKEPA